MSNELDREALKEAARSQAWDEGRECDVCGGHGSVPGGRKLIHTFKGGFGADWDLESIEEWIDQAHTLEWSHGLLGSILVAKKGSDTLGIDMRKPGESA